MPSLRPRRATANRKAATVLPSSPESVHSDLDLPSDSSASSSYDTPCTPRAPPTKKSQKPEKSSAKKATPSAPKKQATPAKDAAPKKARRLADPNAIEDYPSQLTNRCYHGPLRMRRRVGYVLERFYGPEDEDIKAAAAMVNFWYRKEDAPTRAVDFQPLWLPDDFAERQSQMIDAWRRRPEVIAQREPIVSTSFPRLHEVPTVLLLESDESKVYPQQSHWMSGPPNSPGGPGWVVNLAGTVLDMSWCPKVVNGRQTLAICLVPFSESESSEGTEKASNGVLQLLTFEGWDNMPRGQPLVRELTVPWGFSRRAKWCVECGTDGMGMLAVLSTDGEVHVLDVEENDGYTGDVSKVATLSLTGDPVIKATCFTWTTPTRITLGHSDGSISLWSISPLTMLSRHPTHHSTVVDVTSGYPSRPLLTVSVPVAGLVTLQDLASPSSETTSWALPSIGLQSTALQWHDDLQGFYVNHPSSSPLDCSVSFMHSRYFPHGPAVISGNSTVTAFSVGYTHPFMLVGHRDGSVYLANSVKKIFSARSERPQKRRIMHHEFRPMSLWPKAMQDPIIRGASRVTFVDVTESNERKDEKKEETPGVKATRGPGFRVIDPTKAISHEKDTRVACIRWNPLPDAGTWASIAMASGFLFVMDLAVEEQ